MLNLPYFKMYKHQCRRKHVALSQGKTRLDPSASFLCLCHMCDTNDMQ